MQSLANAYPLSRYLSFSLSLSHLLSLTLSSFPSCCMFPSLLYAIFHCLDVLILSLKDAFSLSWMHFPPLFCFLCMSCVPSLSCVLFLLHVPLSLCHFVILLSPSLTSSPRHTTFLSCTCTFSLLLLVFHFLFLLLFHAVSFDLSLSPLLLSLPLSLFAVPLPVFLPLTPMFPCLYLSCLSILLSHFCPSPWCSVSLSLVFPLSETCFHGCFPFLTQFPSITCFSSLCYPLFLPPSHTPFLPVRCIAFLPYAFSETSFSCSPCLSFIPLRFPSLSSASSAHPPNCLECAFHVSSELSHTTPSVLPLSLPASPLAFHPSLFSSSLTHIPLLTSISCSSLSYSLLLSPLLISFPFLPAHLSLSPFSSLACTFPPVYAFSLLLTTPLCPVLSLPLSLLSHSLPQCSLPKNSSFAVPPS